MQGSKERHAGSPTRSTWTKSQLATSPLPSRNCYVTPAFSGVRNAKQGEKIAIGSLTPAFSGAHKWRRSCITLAFSGVPKQGKKIRIGCLSPPFSGARKWAEVLRNPCILGGPQRQARGENQKWLSTPAFSEAQKRAGVLRNPCILGGPRGHARGEFAPPPVPSRGPKSHRK